ncbi:MAG: hypothetical protein ACLTDR_12180 [Adlercreutzia equolifaciens]
MWRRSPLPPRRFWASRTASSPCGETPSSIPWSRTIVGTLVKVGRGQRDPDWVAEVLAARDRQAAGENAPARGLIFWSVGY